MKNPLILPFSLVTEHGEQEESVHLNSGMTQTSVFQRFVSVFLDYINYQATITQLTALSKMILLTQLLHLCFFLAETH